MERKLIQLLIFLAVCSIVVALPVVAAENGKIAFTSNRDGNNEIYSMNPDGSGQIDLSNNPSSDVGPKWSPDGSKIAFLSDRDGYYEIYVMNADGSDQTRITHCGPDAFSYVFFGVGEIRMEWSPDGSKIMFEAFNGIEGPVGLNVINADGSGQTQLMSYANMPSGPKWSPDGSKIAYYGGAIFVMNADGTNEQNIFQCSERYRGGPPSWSPYGNKIALQYGGVDGGSIAIVNTDGSGYSIINAGGSSEFPKWSPDGKMIAFKTYNGISLMDANSGILTQLNSGKPCNQISWSPDSRKLVYLSSKPGNWQINVTNADGSGFVQLTNSGQNKEPSWSTAATPTVLDLVIKVEGLDLPKGIEQGLSAKLDTTQKKITQEQYTPARNTLKAFINQVTAQRGKALTTAQADDLIATAQKIINSIPGK